MIKDNNMSVEKPQNPYTPESDSHAVWKRGYEAGHDYCKAQMIAAVRSPEFQREMVAAIAPMMPARRRELSFWELIKPW